MNRKLLFFLPVLVLALFVQCKDDAVLPDESLIAEIENAQDKINIEPTVLPQAAQQTIDEEYFDTYVESCAYAPNKGFEVIMGNEDRLYFRENGMILRGRLLGSHRPGPCGRGIPVAVEDLPGAIGAYVAEHYPDAEILRAKHFPRGYVVLISGRRLLLFTQGLDFVAETRVFHFCDQIGHAIDSTNLPAGVTEYLSANYPAGELVKAYWVRGRYVVGLITPDGRVILVFDQEGNFLFARG